MKKTAFLFFLLIGWVSMGYAQTKRIAHRSHSGNMYVLDLTLPDNLGDAGINWNPPPVQPVITTEKPKVEGIIVNDSVIQVKHVPAPAPLDSAKQDALVDSIAPAANTDTLEQSLLVPALPDHPVQGETQHAATTTDNTSRYTTITVPQIQSGNVINTAHASLWWALLLVGLVSGVIVIGHRRMETT